MSKYTGKQRNSAGKPAHNGPNWDYEAQYYGSHQSQLAGIDEAGRGPLAGPVVAAAVILDPAAVPAGLNDSKALSPARRRSLYIDIHECAQIGIGIAEPAEIDLINIREASFAAMRRALTSLPRAPGFALVDGNGDPGLPIPAKCIVKGDAKSLSIAAASIVAKVTRDRIMQHAHTRYPAYGFDGHKGYPTAAHRAVLARIGPCPCHRASFAPVRASLHR